MGEKGNFLRKLADSLVLPGEALPGKPVAELLGEDRVLVENHRGILAYSEEEVLVKVKYGSLRITGADLHLTSMTDAQVIVTGKIQDLQVIRRESC